MTSVRQNSVSPTAKIVLYSIEPVGTSPAPVAPMNAVIVSTARRGLNVRFGCWPAAMSTIIVSPPARATGGTTRPRGEGGDRRNQHASDHEPRRQRVEDLDADADVAQERCHEGEGEVAEDDR